MITQPTASPSTHPTLPGGWRWANLGSLCTLVNGDAYKASEWTQHGVPIIRIQNLNDERKPFNYWSGPLDDRVIVKDGAVLLAWSGTPGTSFGAHLWTRGSGVLNQHIFRVDLQGDTLIPEWAVLAINHQLEVLIRKAHGGVGLRHVTKPEVQSLYLPIPPRQEQERISAILAKQMAAVERIRAAIEEQSRLFEALNLAQLRESLTDGPVRPVRLADCLVEISEGVGEKWRQYPLLGATRAGIADAKEPVGKRPERYKLVEAGSIFYNPMRILLGSIAFLEDGEAPGITSPDYVVFKATPGILHPRWFYHWLRSADGAAFIKTLARGAVRERMLFRRLAAAEVHIPSWETQVHVAGRLAVLGRARSASIAQRAVIDLLAPALLRQAFGGCE